MRTSSTDADQGLTDNRMTTSHLARPEKIKSDTPPHPMNPNAKTRSLDPRLRSWLSAANPRGSAGRHGAPGRRCFMRGPAPTVTYLNRYWYWYWYWHWHWYCYCHWHCYCHWYWYWHWIILRPRCYEVEQRAQQEQTANVLARS